MPWLRLWIDILDDPDIHELPNATCWGWTLMLAAAKKHDQDGKLPPAKVLTHWLREKASTVSGWIDDLVEAGLVERDGEDLAIHGWARWQEPSDRTNAARQARFKAKRKSPPAPPEEKEETRPDQTRGSRYPYGVTAGSNGVTRPLPQEVTALPGDEDDVVVFGRSAIGDRFDLEAIPLKLSGWRAAGYQDAWIKDAVLAASCAEAGKLGSYMNTCLRRWKTRGGPDPEEMRKAKAAHQGPTNQPGGPTEAELLKIREEMAGQPRVTKAEFERRLQRGG